MAQIRISAIEIGFIIGLIGRTAAVPTKRIYCTRIVTYCVIFDNRILSILSLFICFGFNMTHPFRIWAKIQCFCVGFVQRLY